MSHKLKILITGGSGLLGVNLAYSFRNIYSIILCEHQRKINISGVDSVCIDFQDEDKLFISLKSISPDLVINCAAYTDVDNCEVYPDIAMNINARLAEKVARCSNRLNIGFIHISTDHLYSDSLNGKYTELDETVVRNMYAYSKLEAEKAVLCVHKRPLIIRTNFFAWGHNFRSSFSDWIIRSLRDKIPIRVFTDVYFTPIICEVLGNSVIKLYLSNLSGIYNIVSDNRLSKYDFAKKVASRFSLEQNLIIPCLMEEISLRAPRPKNLSLDNNKAQIALGGNIGTVDDFIDILYYQESRGLSKAIFDSIYEE